MKLHKKNSLGQDGTKKSGYCKKELIYLTKKRVNKNMSVDPLLSFTIFIRANLFFEKKSK